MSADEPSGVVVEISQRPLGVEIALAPALFISAPLAARTTPSPVAVELTEPLAAMVRLPFLASKMTALLDE